jgi:hypothetical protein
MNKIIIALLATTSLAFAAEGVAPHRPFDTDGDKALSKEEWIARAAAHFDMADVNKDGKVTPDEARAFHKAMVEKRADRREERKEKREERKEAK